MANSPFIFSSDSLPKRKAKQLATTFPHLKLSAAQEATALALGYSSWFECVHRGALGQSSLSDEDSGISVRVARYYHHANVLMGLGITPAESDLFVRAWGLTGRPTLAPKRAVPLYHSWNSVIESFERGELSEDDLLSEFGDQDSSKFPEIDRPERVCPGVILGPMGRYPHYAVAPAVATKIPLYLRGPHSTYHYTDDGDVLSMCVPGFPASGRSERLFPRLNRIQHEWHWGCKHPNASEELVPKLAAAAKERPEDFLVVSERWMPALEGKYDPNRVALACLRGSDFAAFLSQKGAIDPSKVVWFRDVESPSMAEWGSWLQGFGRSRALPELPVFEEACKHKPSLPLYSYPFMTAPMSADECHGPMK